VSNENRRPRLARQHTFSEKQSSRGRSGSVTMQRRAEMTDDEPPSDDPIVRAAVGLLDELMPLLAERCQDTKDPPLELLGLNSWIPRPPLGPAIRSYTAVPRVLSAEQQCAMRVVDEMRGARTEPLVNLEQALATDPVIGPRLQGDSVTSFGAGGGAWQSPSVILILVDRAVDEADRFELGPEATFTLAVPWASELRRPADRITAVTALHEFYAPDCPLVVEPGLEIDELSEDEIAVALTFGGGLSGLAVGERIVSRTFGIRSSFESRLFIDAIPQTEAEREQEIRQELEARIALVVLALRVFKSGRIGTSGSFQYRTSPWSGVSPVQGSLGRFFGWHAAEPYILSPNDVIFVQRFLEGVQQCPKATDA
jgi:hypothetical protein